MPVNDGAFDSPDWFEKSPKTARHTFLNFQQRGTLSPAGYEVFWERAVLNDGTHVLPEVFSKPYQMG